MNESTESRTITTRELQDEWIEALESGKYPQGKHMLRSSDGYCCLGVACEILVKHGLIERGAGGGSYGLEHKTTHYLCKEAIHYLGMYGDTGSPCDYINLSPDSEPLSLATYNDKLNLSFDNIAKLLRERRDIYFDPEKSNQQIPLPT